MSPTMTMLGCEGCGASFERRASEVKRQRGKNPDRRFYCSRRCYARSDGLNNLGERLVTGSPENLDAGNRRDVYSPFRYFLRKARNRKYATDLDLACLAGVWQSQASRCALSGLAMDLPATGREWEQRTRDPWKPSLDRIDPDRGYVKGNVRFVTVIANLAKHEFRDEDVVAFARAVVERADARPGKPD